MAIFGLLFFGVIAALCAALLVTSLPASLKPSTNHGRVLLSQFTRGQDPSLAPFGDGGLLKNSHSTQYFALPEEKRDPGEGVKPEGE